jgi:hypothetical protein
MQMPRAPPARISRLPKRRELIADLHNPVNPEAMRQQRNYLGHPKPKLSKMVISNKIKSIVTDFGSNFNYC